MDQSVGGSIDACCNQLCGVEILYFKCIVWVVVGGGRCKFAGASGSADPQRIVPFPAGYPVPPGSSAAAAAAGNLSSRPPPPAGEALCEMTHEHVYVCAQAVYSGTPV